MNDTSLPPTHPNPTARDLTGVWYQTGDSAYYYIREYLSGPEIPFRFVWSSQATEESYGCGVQGAYAFSNVAYGKREGNLLELFWVDVPKGYCMNGGRALLEIVDDGDGLRLQWLEGDPVPEFARGAFYPQGSDQFPSEN
ncbi:hypothetical protein [Endothiovibrio diazotrophicus]